MNKVRSENRNIKKENEQGEKIINKRSENRNIKEKNERKGEKNE